MLATGENDLESQYPDIAKEFVVKKNERTPDNVIITDKDATTWWKCSENHLFQRSVWHRIYQNSGCPVCNRSIIVKGINDLQTKYPDILKIWDFIKNIKKTDEISDKTTDKFYFKCELGHRYKTYIRSIVHNEFKCMVCSGKIYRKV